MQTHFIRNFDEEQRATTDDDAAKKYTTNFQLGTHPTPHIISR